jgi:hypothetical protein
LICRGGSCQSISRGGYYTHSKNIFLLSPRNFFLVVYGIHVFHDSCDPTWLDPVALMLEPARKGC